MHIIARILVTVVVLAATIVITQAPASAQAALFAVLVGGNEPLGGDTDAFGSATVTIRGTTLCWSVLVTGLDTPNGAHIHKGAAGVNGPIVVPLTAPSGGNPGTSSDCVTGVSGTVLSDIRANRQGYYINVHSIAFPGGAMRGQLF